MTDLVSDARSLPAQLRETLRPLLPEGAFLRRDRGDALFVTNAPFRTDAAVLKQTLAAAGFLCEDRGGLLALTPGPQFLTNFENRHPAPDFLCETLLRFRGQAPCGDALKLFACGLQLLEHPGDTPVYLRRVRELAAVCLRTGQGGVYACALTAHVLERKETSP